VDLCRCLLEGGANPSLQNLQGLSAWNLALHSGTAEAFHDLLGPLEEPTATSPRTDTYEQDFRNELRDAVRACDVERLGSVLDSGSSLPSARRVEILGESDGSGRTLLHLCPTWANSNNATKAVRKLLDSSANCDAVDAFGRTPLEAAIESCAQREMEDPEPVLKLCEALIPHSSTQVFLDKQTGDTAIGRAVVTLLQDHGVAVEVEGEPAPTEAVEESTVAAGPETSKRAGGLRKRCEQLGLPIDKLGTFAAAPLLAECERLLNLSLPELQMEWRQSCACEEPQGGDLVERKDQLIERLKQLAIWRALPTSELQDQCRCTAADLAALGAKRAGRALDRDELLEVLAVATWGGLMRSEALQDECAAKGIPVDQLGLEEAERLLSAQASLEKMTLEDLRQECRKQRVAPRPKASKAELVKQLSELLLWCELPLSALRNLCKEKGLPIRGDQRRAGLLRLLREESWRLRGIPLDRIEHETVAQDLLDKVEAFEAQNIETLRSKSRSLRLPFHVLGDKSEMIACLTDYLVWQRMSTELLQSECQQRSTQKLKPEEGSQTNQTHDLLVTFLVEHRLVQAWRDAGQDKRITSFQAVEGILKEVRRLEQLPLSELQKQFKMRGCPAEAGLARKTLLDRLTMALVWEALTLQEIRRECQSRDVCFTGLRSRNEAEQRQELTERLFTSVCHSAWETQGIPVKRLGGGQAAAKVVERIARLSELTLEDLRVEFQALKIPAEAGEPAKKRELLKVLEKVAMWQEMPLKELQKDCREMEVSTSSLSGVRLSDAEQRKELIQRCCLGLFLLNWSSQGVPVKRLECMQAALQVVKRVQALDAMSEAVLRSEYAKLVTLPSEAGKERTMKEVLQRLQEVARWQQLPLREVQRECRDCDISTGGVSAKLGDLEQRAELVERLILVKYADRWVEQGLPVKRIGGIKAATRLSGGSGPGQEDTPGPFDHGFGLGSSNSPRDSP